MPRPFHVRTLDDYADWVEKQIEWFGGELDPALWVEEAHEDDGAVVALQITRQRASFAQGSLHFQVTIDRELNLMEYNYHYAGNDEWMTLRFDMHPGHEDKGGERQGLCHVHRPVADEVQVKGSPEMHIDDVLTEILGPNPVVDEP